VNLGLSIFRTVKEIDSDTLGQINRMTALPAYRERNIVGAIVTPRETFVNVDLPLSIEITEELAENTRGFAVIGPNGDIVSRCGSIPEAEEIVRGAKVSLKVDKQSPAVAGPASA
jgi:hypothetical protein